MQNAPKKILLKRVQLNVKDQIKEKKGSDQFIQVNTPITKKLVDDREKMFRSTKYDGVYLAQNNPEFMVDFLT